jgi:hypothetical protein
MHTESAFEVSCLLPQTLTSLAGEFAIYPRQGWLELLIKHGFDVLLCMTFMRPAAIPASAVPNNINDNL